MISIGSDHGGFPLKQEVIKHLDELGLEYKDYGTYTEDSCDYPLYGEAVARAVASGEAETGIAVCGTGIGISITANKIKGIRAAAVSDVFSARYTRMHNDANVLCLGSRVIGVGLAWELVEAFVTAEFEGGKHARRVDEIRSLEENGTL